jgi:hypothetical protein
LCTGSPMAWIVLAHVRVKLILGPLVAICI